MKFSEFCPMHDKEIGVFPVPVAISVNITTYIHVCVCSEIELKAYVHEF